MGLNKMNGGRTTIRQLTVDLVPYVLSQLLPLRDRVINADTLNIEVSYTNSILRDGNIGLCTCLDADEDSPVDFLIQIAGAPVHRQLRTLAHELVHVVQFASGDLRVTGNTTCSYRGKDYDVNADDYRLRDYEVQAYGLEGAMVDMFIVKHNLIGAAWFDPSLC